MQQSVRSAKINESTEICDVLYDTVNDIADIKLGEKLLLLLHLLFDKQLLAVTDDTVTTRIELCDYKLDLLILVLIQIALVCIGYKAGRDKDLRLVNHNTQAAAKNLCYLGCQHFTALTSLTQLLVALFGCKALVSQHNLTVTVIDFHNLDCHGVAYMKYFSKIHISVVAVFAACQNTVIFIADVQDGLIRAHLNDLTVEHLAIVDLFKCFFQHLFKRLFF